MRFQWVTWVDAAWWGFLIGCAIAAAWCSGCSSRQPLVQVPELYVNPPAPPPEYSPIPPPREAGANPPLPALCCASLDAGISVPCTFMSWVCSVDGSPDIESLAYCGSGACRQWSTCWISSGYQGAEGITWPCSSN